MRTTLLFCAALLAAPIGTGHAQAIWKWTDERGVTHYSDQPGPGAVRVDLSTSQVYSSDEARTDIDVNTQPQRAQPADANYTSLRISQPTDDQVLFAGDGPVSVQVSIEPGVQSGHRIQILMDGQVVGENSMSATLQQVSRGTHTVQARVVDGSDETIVASTPVTFHMRQPTVRRN